MLWRILGFFGGLTFVVAAIDIFSSDNCPHIDFGGNRRNLTYACVSRPVDGGLSQTTAGSLLLLGGICLIGFAVAPLLPNTDAPDGRLSPEPDSSSADPRPPQGAHEHGGIDAHRRIYMDHLIGRGVGPDLAAAAVIAVHPLDDQPVPGREFEQKVRELSITATIGIRDSPTAEGIRWIADGALRSYRRLAIDHRESYYIARYDPYISAGP